MRDYYIAKGQYLEGIYKVRVPPFVFDINSHDTGVSVVCNIKKPSGGHYEIIRGTYWYNESQYGFNTFKKELGAWDESLETVIEGLREELSERYTNKLNSLNKEKLELEKEYQGEKDEVEEMFK